MKLSKVTMSRGIWAYIFFFIALEPAAFQHYGATYYLFTAAQFIMFAIMLYFSLNKYNRHKEQENKVCIFTTVYYIYFVFNTFLQGGRTVPLTIQAIHFIGFLLYLDIVLKYNPKEIFKAPLNILTLYLFTNCLLVFVLKDGLYETVYYTNNYLLGYDNQNINFILPQLVLVLLKNECLKKCKFQVFFSYILAWMTAIKIWSGMTLVVTSLMTIVALFCLKGSEGFIIRHIFTGKIFNFRNLLIVGLVANVALVYYRLQYYLEFLIVYVLKRNLTLTNRTMIWDKTIQFIQRKPWFGYGRENYGVRALKYGFRAESPVGLHAHNRLLETVYSGGIIMLGLFLYIMFYASYCLMKVKDTTFAKILSFGIFIYLVGMLSEYYDYCIFFWGFLVMAENAEGILKKLKSVQSV